MTPKRHFEINWPLTGTPPRTLRISRLKSQFLKPTFLAYKWWWEAKSLFTSRAGNHFYGTKHEIFDRLAILKRSFGSIMFFFRDKIFFFQKYCSVCTKKLNNIFFIELFFFSIFLAKNGLNIYNQFVLLYCRHLPAQLIFNDYWLWWKVV